MEHCYALMIAVLLMGFASVFAGYSFPGEAEEQTSDRFRQMHRSMELDETNYLVNIAGREYAQCMQVFSRSQKSGVLDVHEKTEDGRPISGLIDVVYAQHDDSDSLTHYIDDALSRWVKTEPFASTMRKHNRYGCSIQPNCNGKAVIACLFASL